jgi:hypothetical protein
MTLMRVIYDLYNQNRVMILHGVFFYLCNAPFVVVTD